MQILFQSAYDFPDPRFADPSHEGLIAIGADLQPQTLLHAYSIGLFPWFNEDEGDDIAWYSPSPRCVLYPEQYQPSKSLWREMKKSPYRVSINQHFADVMAGCADVRSYCDSTWIGQSMQYAYQQLHQLGYAFSVEILDGDALIGGLYGLKIGQAFFGESMFHRRTNASKMAFFVLAQLCRASGFKWIDCQLPNEHLLSMGAEPLSREEYLTDLQQQIRLADVDWSDLYTPRPLTDYVDITHFHCHEQRLQMLI